MCALCFAIGFCFVVLVRFFDGWDCVMVGGGLWVSLSVAVVWIFFCMPSVQGCIHLNVRSVAICFGVQFNEAKAMQLMSLLCQSVSAPNCKPNTRSTYTNRVATTRFCCRFDDLVSRVFYFLRFSCRPISLTLAASEKSISRLNWFKRMFCKTHIITLRHKCSTKLYNRKCVRAHDFVCVSVLCMFAWAYNYTSEKSR